MLTKEFDSSSFKKTTLTDLSKTDDAILTLDIVLKWEINESGFFVFEKVLPVKTTYLLAAIVCLDV